MNTVFKILRFSCLICIGLIFFACNKEGVLPEKQAELQEKVIENVTYGTHQRQKMDVFLPKGRNEKTAVVVLIHGGYWIGGDKSDFTAIQELLSGRGIASINLNYRYVSPEHDYSGLMADVKSALGVVKNNADTWGIRNRDFHLVGASAGGYMALLYGYYSKSGSEVRSVVSLAGPTGFPADMFADLDAVGDLKQPVEWLVGAPLPTGETDPNLAKYIQASPISYVDRAVPTLMIHGTADEVVPYVMSEELKGALDAVSVTNKLVTLNGVSHDISESPVGLLTAINELYAWITAREK